MTPVCCHLEVANSGCLQISKWEDSCLLPFQRSQCGLLVNTVVGILVLDNLLNTNCDLNPLILDQLGIGSSPNPQYQVLEYSEHRLFSRGKKAITSSGGSFNN